MVQDGKEFIQAIFNCGEYTLREEEKTIALVLDGVKVLALVEARDRSIREEEQEKAEARAALESNE